MADTQKFQRRKLLVKHQLQFKYMAVVFASVLLLCAIVWTDAYYTMLKMALVDNPSLGPFLLQFNNILIVKVVIYLALILLISLYISHRIAGPVYRFEKSAQIAASGNLVHRVSLRSGDELVELQEEFNAMLASLQALVRKDRTLAQHLAERLGAVLKRLPEGPETAALTEELGSLQKDLQHMTGSFKV